MPQNESVDEFISKEGFDQIERLKKEIPILVAGMTTLSKAAKETFSSLTNTTGFAEILKQAKNAEKANTEMAAAVDDLGGSYKAVISLMEVHNGKTGEVLKNMKLAEQATKATTETTVTAEKRKTETAKQTTEASKQATEATKQATIASVADAKATTEAARTKEIETRYTILLTKEKDRLQKAADREQAQANKLTNAYEILKKKYSDTANEAKRLSAEFGVNSSQAAAFNAQAAKMGAELLKIEAAVGQHQRAVGNYASATMSLTQVIREAPAFANSMATGLSAIGNNLPILGDEFGKLRKELGSTSKAFGIFFKSLFSLSNIFILGFAAFEIFGKGLFTVSEAEKEAKEQADSYTKSLKTLEATAYANASKEVSRINLLTSISRDNAQATENRLLAVQALQKEFPQYFGALKEEAILNGNIQSAIEGATQAIFKKAAANAATSKFEEAAKREYELMVKQRDALKEYNDYIGKFSIQAKKLADGNLTVANSDKMSYEERKKATAEALKGRALLAQEGFDFSKYEKLQNSLTDAIKQRNLIRKEMRGFLTDAQSMAKELGSGFFDKALVSDNTIAELEQQVSKLTETRDKSLKINTADGVKQVRALTAEIAAIQLRIDDLKGKKGPKQKDTIAADISSRYQAEKDYNDAIYELAKQRYRNDADTQELIFSNEQETLQKRLEAYEEYEKDLLAIASLENQREVTDLKLKQKEFQDKEDAYQAGKLKITKEAHEALQKEVEAYGLKITAKEEERQNKVAAINLAGKNKRLAITRSSNEVWLRSEETSLQDRINDYEKQYDTEKDLLDKSLSGKLITTTAYEQKLKDLRRSYDTIILNEQIAQYEYELKNAQLTADEKLSIETKLNNAIRQRRNIVATKDLEDTKAVEAAKAQIRQNEIQAIETGFEIGFSLLDSYYQKELDYQQQVLQGIQTKRDKEIQAVQDSTQSERSKKIAIASINAQAAADEKKQQQEVAKVKRQAAIAERAAAILNIAEQAAIAEVAALKLLSNPATAALYPLLAGSIAAKAIASTALILAKPLPAYEHGTPPEGHPGGKALIGEVRPETVIEPGKEPYNVYKPTIKHLAAGTHVLPRAIPEQELVKMSLANMYGVQFAGLQIPHVSNDFTALQATIEQSSAKTARAVVSAVSSMPQPIYNQTPYGWSKAVRYGGKTSDFITRIND